MDSVPDKNKVPYKRLTPDELSEEGALQLAAAIAREAVMDYDLALKSGNDLMKEHCERFFLSAYFSNLTGLNGRAVIDKARREAKKDLEKEKKETEKDETDLATIRRRNEYKEALLLRRMQE